MSDEFDIDITEILEQGGPWAKQGAKVIKSLRAEIEALKQQVEQGKRDAVPEDIRKDAESWRFYKKRKDEVIAAGMGRKILRDAAAPKEK